MHFSVEIRHPELHKYQVIFGRTPEEAREKARAKLAQWDDQHRRMVKFEKRKLLSWSKQERAEMSKREATALSLDAKFRFEEIENTLINIINKTKLNPVTFMKTVVTFDLTKPPTPSYVNFPIEPDRNDQKYVVTFPSEPNRIDRKYYAHVPLISRLIPYRVRNLTRAMDARYNEDHEFWDEHCANLAKFMDTNFQEDHRLWETQCTEIDVENNQKFDRFTESITEWERQRQNVIGINLARRAEYDNLIENTRALDCDSVEQYFSYVNQNVEWPRELEPTVEFMFEGPTGIISIDCDLPNVDDMPSVKLVKYITSRDSLEEITYKKDTLNILYDNFIYQIILALMWQIINFDDENVVKAISINGWVSYINKANGLDETACIASVYSTKEQFQTLQLDRVEARLCFRHLKGIANTRIHEFVPVKPILNLNRNDKRFVAGADVLGGMKEGTNIAAMGWEEFEHLIREVFEREFSRDGGQVKITQASRDGGVDAIVFDPDPFRGGKIIIQAKRYTNTVDVGAVRDLFGTMHNEGAMRGILVTTSTFGPDSYNFVKDKAITLIDGNNLLYLMEKHGHNVRINLSEAKKLGVGLKR